MKSAWTKAMLADRRDARCPVMWTCWACVAWGGRTPCGTQSDAPIRSYMLLLLVGNCIKCALTRLRVPREPVIPSSHDHTQTPLPLYPCHPQLFDSIVVALHRPVPRIKINIYIYSCCTNTKKLSYTNTHIQKAALLLVCVSSPVLFSLLFRFPKSCTLYYEHYIL